MTAQFKTLAHTDSLNPPTGQSWGEFAWPDWVPTHVQVGVEHHFPTGPQDWLLFARAHRAPEFGAELQLATDPDQTTWITGRYVHYGTDLLGRLVRYYPTGVTAVTYLAGGHVVYLGEPKR